jgi:hypothetical protein
MTRWVKLGRKRYVRVESAFPTITKYVELSYPRPLFGQPCFEPIDLDDETRGTASLLVEIYKLSETRFATAAALSNRDAKLSSPSLVTSSALMISPCLCSSMCP